MVLKWGIVGAGNISRQFAKALLVCKDQNELVAVGAQNEERAKNFSLELNIPKAYGTYEELAQDPEIDIVYIGNLNHQHLSVSTLMLENNKHVLCEKPLTLNEKQTTQLVAVAHSKKKFLMEAIWSRYFPAYQKLQQLLKSDLIGDVLYVHATFGRRFEFIERLACKELGGGTILDLGIYGLQIVQFLYNGDEPVNLVAQGHLNENGVDESANTILTFEGGRTAVISSNSTVGLPNDAVVCGTKGTIVIPRFWCPTSIITPTETIEFELPKTDLEFRHSYTVGLTYEILEVGKCIAAGLLESPKMTHKESIQLARLMDQVRKGVGVKFECD